MSKKDTLVLVLLLVFTIGSAVAYFMWEKISTGGKGLLGDKSNLGGGGGGLGGFGLGSGLDKLIPSANLADVAKRISESMIKVGANRSILEVQTNVAHHVQFAQFMEFKANEIAAQIDKEWKENKTWDKKKEIARELGVVHEYSQGAAELVTILDEMVLRGYIEQEVRDCVNIAFMARDGSSKFSAKDWAGIYAQYITYQ